jgi:hypothetical protein
MKKTNIYQGRDLIGRFTCDGKRCTKWQVIKYKTKRFFKKLAMILILILVGIIVAKIWFPSTVVNLKETRIEVDNLTNKVEQLKNEVLDDLKNCESGGISEADGLIVFDSNKKASLGLYQFQVTTVQHYYKKIYGKVITPKEAILTALDEAKARSLARDIIFTEPKGANNWFNCKNKKGLDSKINIIKTITN